MDRKEAIEVVRKKVDYYEADKRLKAALEALIPELAESEDERIRKALIQFLRDYPHLPNGKYSRSDFFAWLEKQKEQKSVECSDCKEYDLGFERGREEGVTAGYNKAMKEMEQREQKPAEWSDDDDEQLNWFYRLLDFIGKEFPSTWGQNHKGGKEWLKSRRPQPNNNLRWRRATEGANLPESIILPDGEEPRFGKCAVRDSYYIPVEELKNLPKDES